MEHDIRPWGEYFVLDDSKTHKVKRIVVKPGGRLSYQYHFHRAEVWTIVEGEALITIDGVDKTYKVGEVAIIPLKAKHRIQNATNENLVLSKCNGEHLLRNPISFELKMTIIENSI